MSADPPDVPLWLAVDTATNVASWALWRGVTPVAERSAEEGPTAAVLLPALDALLEESGIGLERVGGFAVSIGPGSFTGLRIGVATVQGLAFEPGLPAVAVSTLAAVARHAGSAGPVAAVLDARRGEVYAAGFELAADGGLSPAAWLREGVIAVGALSARLPAGCRLVGEAVPLCLDALRDTDAVVVPTPYRHTTAFHVAALAVSSLAGGQARPASALVPRYVRRAEAEVKRTGERFEPL